VICLDVEVDGEIQRGYTIKRMVSLVPERNPPIWKRLLKRTR
jgi:hypothetical protein